MSSYGLSARREGTWKVLSTTSSKEECAASCGSCRGPYGDDLYSAASENPCADAPLKADLPNLPCIEAAVQSATDVTVGAVFEVMARNVGRAREAVRNAAPRVAGLPPCGCHTALQTAILTAPDAISDAARLRLGLLLERPLGGAE